MATLSPGKMAQHPANFAQEQVAAVRAELQSILTSDSFSGSHRCRDFLELVVSRALAGDHESLTERFLGVELFGRAIDYETSSDAIVRVRANDVRRRLAQYYAERQSDGPVRIELIAGAYVPEFHWGPNGSSKAGTSAILPGHTNPAEEKVASEIPPVKLPVESSTRSRHRAQWIAGGALIVVAAIMALLLLRPRPSNFDRFWHPVLHASSSPVLVLPTTNTLQVALNAEKKYPEPTSGTPVSYSIADLQQYHNWHVSLPVLQGTMSVALALQRKGQTPIVRIGTDLKQDELRGHPVIAVGSFSNPWTRENISALRFTFDRGESDNDSPRIRDSRNPQRFWMLTSTYPESQSKDYAIITRTFDPETHVPFVSLAGLHSFGNQIAGEFITQEASWNDFASRVPAGWDEMNLQIVLEADLIGTTPSAPRIVDVYVWR